MSLSVVGMRMCESGGSGEVFYFKGFLFYFISVDVYAPAERQTDADRTHMYIY